MSDHLTNEELQQRLADAAQQVRVGARYNHYKDPTKTYRVKELVVIEATNQVGVVYVAEYANNLTYIRPLSSWLDKIDWQGKVVSRFAFVEK